MCLLSEQVLCSRENSNPPLHLQGNPGAGAAAAGAAGAAAGHRAERAAAHLAQHQHALHPGAGRAGRCMFAARVLPGLHERGGGQLSCALGERTGAMSTALGGGGWLVECCMGHSTLACCSPARPSVCRCARCRGRGVRTKAWIRRYQCDVLPSSEIQLASSGGVQQMGCIMNGDGCIKSDWDGKVKEIVWRGGCESV